MANIFEGKTVLVTGGAGSIGSELVRAVLQYKPLAVRVFDNNETGLFDLEQGFQSKLIRLLVGDIKDKERLKRAVEGVDYIFHAAALKHVPLCEYNPFEAVKTNVVGTQNLIEVALEEEVDKVITISTDKAVNPINVMGATKLLSERLTICANYYKGPKRTVFSCVRFGNVLDSRGSVIPLFREQIKHGGPVTITDMGMTRFIMSIPKAVNLVFKAAEIMQGGEIFIFKMPAIRITDLARALIEELAPLYGYKPGDIKMDITGIREGEKLYEELITLDETPYVSEIEEMFIVNRNINNKVNQKILIGQCRSDEDAILLTKEAIKEMLKDMLT